MLTVADTRELVDLMGQVVSHAQRVDGIVYKVDDVGLHQHHHTVISGDGYWSWTASVGTHKGYDCSDRRMALNALLGILGSMRSKS